MADRHDLLPISRSRTEVGNGGQAIARGRGQNLGVRYSLGRHKNGLVSRAPILWMGDLESFFPPGFSVVKVQGLTGSCRSASVASRH